MENIKRDVWVVTNGNSVGGIGYTLEEAESVRKHTTNGNGVPQLLDYDIVKVAFAFTKEFEDWYNGWMFDGGEDIYTTDGDCLLAGVEEGQVIDEGYLIGNLNWLEETDDDNIGYWKENGDPDGYTPSARKHKRWVRRTIKEILQRTAASSIASRISSR